jgi:hypothetical protein
MLLLLLLLLLVGGATAGLHGGGRMAWVQWVRCPRSPTPANAAALRNSNAAAAAQKANTQRYTAPRRAYTSIV